MMNTLLLRWGLLVASVYGAITVESQDTSFTNPIIYEDYPDNDISLGPDGAYYFSASNFHYSPGAPILRSFDLVNWEPIGHSIPRLNFGDGYDLPDDGERAYRGGTWASTLRYRESNGLWYWIGCTNFYNTWVFTAESVEGPWENSANLGGGNCYYDCGLLIDDDDTMYVVYASNEVRVAQLSADGFEEVRSENVFNASDVGAESIEGNRLYKIRDLYYILNDLPGSTTYIWKSESPWGPWEAKILVESVTSPLEGGSSPHQGSLIQTPDGDWYYMSFTWAFPAGRLPVLAPLTWGDDGFPSLVEGDNGGWGKTYSMPDLGEPLTNWTGVDTFQGTSLGVQWEWNHNPDDSSYEVNDGLTLKTSSVTEDLYSARNTLTHRVHGEFPVATVKIDFSNAAHGDRFGLSAFRDRSAYIGLHHSADGAEIVAKFNMTIDEWSGETLDLGQIVATEPLEEGITKIWFRTEMDVRPTGDRAANFSYSMDGDSFHQLGGTYRLYDGWPFFLGYRFGIFNHATADLGGSIRMLSFTTE